MCSKNVVFAVLFIIFIGICLFKPGALEHWEIYKQKPYGYLKTGASPLQYYQQVRYRKPYRYPYQFRKSYPVDHMSYWD